MFMFFTHSPPALSLPLSSSPASRLMSRADHDGVMVLAVVVATVTGERSDGRGSACHRRPAERKLDDRGAQPQGQRGMACTNFKHLNAFCVGAGSTADRVGSGDWQGRKNGKTMFAWR